MPTQWYNVIPDLPAPPPPPLHPGTHEPVGPEDLAPLFPMALIEQEVTGRALRRHPRRRARRLPAVAAEPAVPGPPPRAPARHPGQDLLQVRGRQPGRLAQAEHVGAAGLLQPPGGHPEADDGDRRRAVGHGAGVRRRAVRHRLRDLAGRRVVPLEAVPPHDDGDLRGHAALQPVAGHRVRPLPARRRPRPQRQPRHRHLRGGRRRRRRPRHALRARAACSTTCCCTRRSSARRPCCSWPRPARRPTCSSAAPAAAPTSAAWRSRSCARSSPGGWTRRSAASSRRPARA